MDETGVVLFGVAVAAAVPFVLIGFLAIGSKPKLIDLQWLLLLPGAFSLVAGLFGTLLLADPGLKVLELCTTTAFFLYVTFLIRPAPRSRFWLIGLSLGESKSVEALIADWTSLSVAQRDQKSLPIQWVADLLIGARDPLSSTIWIGSRRSMSREQVAAIRSGAIKAGWGGSVARANAMGCLLAGMMLAFAVGMAFLISALFP
jgi:hypothetical protein